MIAKRLLGLVQVLIDPLPEGSVGCDGVLDLLRDCEKAFLRGKGGMIRQGYFERAVGYSEKTNRYPEKLSVAARQDSNV